MGTVVFVAYRFRTGAPFTFRGLLTYGLAVAGALALFDGGTLLVREEMRARHGRVTPGVVVEKYSSTGADGSRSIGRGLGRSGPQRSQRIVTIKEFQLHDVLARWIVTGSPNAWVIAYRCNTRPGCYGRDFVTEAQWRRVAEGQAISVRQTDAEDMEGRLDGYPQWRTALADITIGAILLLFARVAWGGLALFRGPAWITAPAVVLAVEVVHYKDARRWRIRFAYFDQDGAAQESADEVAAGSWRVGDACVAVFRPSQPGLATLQPAAATDSIAARRVVLASRPII